jgi:hypothetical protein
LQGSARSTSAGFDERRGRTAEPPSAGEQDNAEPVTLLDAYALVAFLVGGPAAADVRALLREGDAAVATANLAEALDVSKRVFDLPVTASAAAVEPLLQTSRLTIPFGPEIAVGLR